MVKNLNGGGGAGNVTGPASSTDAGVALFDGITGKLLKDSGKTIVTTLGTTDTTIPTSQAVNTPVAAKKKFHGFVDRTSSTLTWTDSTPDRTLTITGTYTYYYQGVLNSISTAKAAQITNTNGLWWIYFDSAGVLTASQNFPALTTSVVVCTVWWNGTAGFIHEERHGYTRDLDWHAWAHQCLGIRYQTGLAFTFTPATPTVAFALGGGTLWDEDIGFSVPASSAYLPTPHAGRIFYKTNPGTSFVCDTAVSTRPYKWNSGSSRVQFVNSASSYALTDCSDSKYTNVWLYGTMDKNVLSSGNGTNAMFVVETIAGSDGWNSASVARQQPAPDISGLGLNPEIKLLYRIVVKGDGTVQTASTTDDFRNIAYGVAGGSAGTTASAVSFVPAGTVAATNVQAAIEEVDLEKATIASPTFTGVPAAPTAEAGTNTTQLATTAFVKASAGLNTPLGVEWTTNATSPTLVLVDNTGKAITLSAGDWAAHPVFGAIRRCNVSDAGLVTAYYGDPTFSYTGSNGQVMVQIPKFWYRTDALTNKYRFLISPIALSGYKVHPAFIVDSVEKDYIYISAFEGSVYDVTTPAAACVNTIQITAEPTSSGNLTITLDGNYVFTVAILDADTIEGVVDKIVAAGAKTDYQGVVWTPAKTAADTLTYTAGSNGLKTTLIMPTACGVTATITKTNAGAGGYVSNDAYGVDFTAATGDLLSSVAGVKPLSGWNNATATLTNMRKLARNRGTGWELLDFNSVCAVQLLFIIRNATLNSQAIYAGVTAITDATAGSGYNNAINTGFTAGVGTNGVDLGNASGECPSVTHYKTGEAAKAFSIFGIENFWGNIFKWIDGINIKADRNPWIADHDFVVDTFVHPYVDTGFTLPSSSDYGVSVVYSAIYDYLFVPLTVGGSSSQYLCDYYYQSVGNRSVLVGGYWSSAAIAGAFSFAANNAGSGVDRLISARLAFK